MKEVNMTIEHLRNITIDHREGFNKLKRIEVQLDEGRYYFYSNEGLEDYGYMDIIVSHEEDKEAILEWINENCKVELK